MRAEGSGLPSPRLDVHDTFHVIAAEAKIVHHVEHVMADCIHTCNRLIENVRRAQTMQFLAPRSEILCGHHLVNTTEDAGAQSPSRRWARLELIPKQWRALVSTPTVEPKTTSQNSPPHRL